jgi:predicted HTH transcriptional regulator
MGNENGTWIMYGVTSDDPECIHTVDEAIEYINEVGFLPLFKNEIPGFSLEEHTVAEHWWSENPGSFANDFRPEDIVNCDLHSFLRNEMIAKTLYLCKDVETFGSGLRKIYALCDSANIQIGYIDSETDFTIEFSRTDRNNMSENGTINGIINDTLTELEADVLDSLKKNKNATESELVDICGKSARTENKAISSLKSKKLLERVESNKTGYWKVI